MAVEATRPPDRGTFGGLLLRHRVAAALSQEALAERAGLSVRAVSDLERGTKARPHLETVRLLAEALGLPPSERAALAAAARPAAPNTRALPSPEIRGGLPRPLTPLVGRERECERVQAILLRADTRLLTLTGPGGTGKTRLALEVARRVEGAFGDGVCFVSLAAITDPGLVPSEIARALGLRVASEGSLLDRLAESLRPLELVLLLDNVEQLLPATAPAIAALLTSCPTLKIVATSRTALHVSGEREFAVPPLALPDLDRLPPPADLLDVDSVQLFVERGQAVDSDFALMDDTAPVVAAICRRLDGLPLAIELAAARLKALPPGELLRRLDRRLPLLTGGPLDLPARQRTLRDAIAWSHDLLNAEEQVFFRRLAAFAGGFPLEAAEAVCGFGSLDSEVGDASADLEFRTSNLELVASLVDKSLIQRVNGPGGAARFAMLETVREYALERLAAGGEERETRDRHAGWCIDLAERFWTEVFVGPANPPWLETAEAERDNMRTALVWLDQSDQVEGLLRLTGTIWELWRRSGPVSEWKTWFERTLALRDRVPLAVRARAVQGAAVVAREVGDPRAVRLNEEALALFQALGDSFGVAASLQYLGADALMAARYVEADELFARALAICRARGETAWSAVLECRLGSAAYGLHDLEKAKQWFEESLARQRELDDPCITAATLDFLALVAVEQGDLAGAAERLDASLPLMRACGLRITAHHWLALAAMLAHALGEFGSAARLLGAYIAVTERFGALTQLPRRAAYERALETTRARLGEAAFAAASSLGQALPLDEAIRLAEEVLALAKQQAVPPSTPTVAGLTPP
jgi:predicted ATPase/DNA-binding XRE family transcriptional regulator